MTGPMTYDAKWAAEQLGLSPATVLRKAREKDIPHIRVGSRIRFTEANIADYIAAHTVGSAMVRSKRSRDYHTAK